MIGKDLLLGYDIAFIDLYGVIWSGTHTFPAALDAMQRLVAADKKVTILSNASTISDEIVKKYDGENLVAGTHFTDFISSGDVIRSILAGGRLSFSKCEAPKRYFLWGTENGELFAGSNFERTLDLREADFVYLSIPRFSEGEMEEMEASLKRYLYVARSYGTARMWDSVSVEPYIPLLKKFLREKKPLLLANPDKFAICPVLETSDAQKYVPKAIVKQGLIGETYSAMGGEVCAIGKPFPQIYRHALEKLAIAWGKSLRSVCRRRIAMVGDTLATDILGARNATESLGCRVDSILVLTGISAEDMERSGVEFSIESMEKFFAKEKIRPTHTMSALDFDGTVYF
ncbi:MAG: HAD hydrolase-like protein [Puniceicoccales bacterium]|jgi:HAD superfamily hydrolase (TIGR01450 family)|nr:HAD hydrolase-like protein [Puniceicoccales bacterium]